MMHGTIDIKYWRILLLLSSELQVSLKRWCTPELYQGVTENQVFWDVTLSIGEQFPALYSTTVPGLPNVRDY